MERSRGEGGDSAEKRKTLLGLALSSSLEGNKNGCVKKDLVSESIFCVCGSVDG